MFGDGTRLHATYICRAIPKSTLQALYHVYRCAPGLQRRNQSHAPSFSNAFNSSSSHGRKET